jgi:hypothetical protein
VIVRSGNSAAFVNGAGDTSSIYQDVVVRSGQTLNIEMYARVVAPAAIELEVKNLHTGNYWDGGSWSSTQASLFSNATVGSFGQSTASFTVESFNVCESDLVTLRITVMNSVSSSTGYAEDVSLWPAGTNFCGIFGHNVDKSVLLRLRGSTDNFGGSNVLVATLSKTQPSLYATFNAANYRYWRLEAVGANHETIWYGEYVLAQTVTLQRDYNYGSGLTFLQDAIRQRVPGGTVRTHALGARPRRVFGATFDYFDEASYEEARDELVLRARGTVDPIIIIPDDSVNDTVIFGRRVSDSWSTTRSLTTHRVGGEIEIEEDAFPIWVS